MTEVYECHQRLGSAQPREVKHHRVSYARNIQVRWMDAEATDFPHIRRSRVWTLGGKLRKYRKGQVFVIAAYRAKSADELCIGIDGAIGRGGPIELIDLKVSEYR